VLITLDDVIAVFLSVCACERTRSAMLTAAMLICVLLGLPPLALCIIMPLDESEDLERGLFF
jgi:hypothetical protein